MAIPGTARLTSALRAMILAAAKALGDVDVRDFATGGNGTAESPWIGWDTAITWQSNTVYRFAAGYFALANTLTLQSLNDVTLKGFAGATKIVWTGVSSPMIFVDEEAGDYGTFRNRIKGFDFDAGAAATGIVRLRSAHKNILSDLTWTNFPTSGTTYGIKCESLVTPRIENCTALNEDQEDPDANCPTYHLWLTRRIDHPEWTNTIPIIDNCWLKGAKSHGIFIEYAISPMITGGASERAGLGGTGYGVYINASVESGEIHGMDVEACDHGGFYVGGNAWTLTSTTTFGDGCTVVIAGNQNTLLGGFTQDRVTISGNYNRLINFGMRSDLPAPDDSGTGNTWTNNTYNQTSTLDVPVKRCPIFTTSGTVLPGDNAAYFGAGGHTLTLNYSTSIWQGKECDIINYSAFALAIAVTAGGLIVSGVGSEASTQTLPAKTACRITRDSSYWMMRIY